MSSDYYEGRARQYRRDMEKQLKKRGDEEVKAAKAEKATAEAEDKARRASSQSTASSRLREAERKRKDAQKARDNAAKASKAAAELQVKINDAEQKAARDRQREEAADERKRSQTARMEAQRARWREQREAREEAAREAAREREVTELRERTADLEARVREAQSAAPSQITVLFVAGTPVGGREPLRLDREVREIQERVRASEHREAIRMEYRLATRVSDILQALNEFKPDVVHFAGHGSGESLVFEGNNGEPHDLSNQDLALLLQTTPKPIRLIVFNSCESSTRASLACDFVEVAIGMDEPVADEAAKVFAGQFYSSLGFGHDLALAFDQARTQAAVVAGQSESVPHLYTAPGVEAEDVVLVRPANGLAA